MTTNLDLESAERSHPDGIHCLLPHTTLSERETVARSPGADPWLAANRNEIACIATDNLEEYPSGAIRSIKYLAYALSKRYSGETTANYTRPRAGIAEWT